MRYKLKDIFDLQMGKTPSRNNPNYWNSDDHKWISIADLSKTGKYISETKECLSECAIEESGIKAIPANTVIMSFKLSIGKTAITAEDMYSNEAIMAFYDKHVAELLPEYIYYLFTYKNWNEGSNKAVMGKTLNKTTLSEVEIDICSVERQREIIEVLDRTKQIVSDRENQVRLFATLIRARFVEMFENKGYPVCKLSEYTTKITDGTHKTPNYLSEGVVFISAKNIVNGKLNFSDVKHISKEEYDEIQKRCELKKGDILLSKSGSLGAPVVVETDECLGLFESLAVLKGKWNLINNIFLCEQLKSQEIQRQFKAAEKGIAVKHLHLGVIANTNIIVSPIDLQNQFADFVHQVDKSKLSVFLNELQILKCICQNLILYYNAKISS